MSRQITFAASALAEVEAATYYLYLKNSEVARQFTRSLYTSVELLQKSPELGAKSAFKNPRLANVRQWQIKDFPRYIIFYHADETCLVVLHVLHSSRDWQTMLDV